MRQFFALMGLLISAASAFAQAPNMPVITRVTGQKITAVYNDGREAELRFTRGETFPVPVPYKVSENLCKPGEVGAEFNSNIRLRLDRVAWFWTKHPDATKVNGVVVAQYPNGQANPLFSFAFVTKTMLVRYPDLSGDLGLDEYTFGNLSWLPGMENGLTDFTIPVWNAEAMTPNSQTGIPENRVTGGAVDVRMKKINDTTVVMESLGSVHALPIVGYAFAMIGDVVTWKWQMGGQPCVISSKPNLGPANRIVTEKLSQQNLPWQPYLFEQDSLLQAMLPLFNDGGLGYAD